MKNDLTVPTKLRVGYDKRDDTYTGKLAFVTYIDDKNKLRSEKSWESWRDKEIEPSSFDNVPTEGFVINKNGGGGRRSYGWDSRNEFARVYDPRGFEIEIGLENLLFILQECSCNKGKGIEGELVYAWSSKRLVLLPVSSQEYKESVEFTNLKKHNVKKSDIQVGHTYIFKDRTSAIYLGHHLVYSDSNIWQMFYNTTPNKLHIFEKLNITTKTDQFFEESKYMKLKDFSRVAKKISDDPVGGNYAERFEALSKEDFFNPIVKLEIENEGTLFEFTKRAIKDAIQKDKNSLYGYNFSFICVQKAKDILVLKEYSLDAYKMKKTLSELTNVSESVFYESYTGQHTKKEIIDILTTGVDKLTSIRLRTSRQSYIKNEGGFSVTSVGDENTYRNSYYSDTIGYDTIVSLGDSSPACFDGVFTKKNGLKFRTNSKDI